MLLPEASLHPDVDALGEWMHVYMGCQPNGWLDRVFFRWYCDHQHDSEAAMEAGTAARRELALNLNQLQRDMATSSAVADAKVPLTRSLCSQPRLTTLCAVLWNLLQQLAHAAREKTDLMKQLRELVRVCVTLHCVPQLFLLSTLDAGVF